MQGFALKNSCRSVLQKHGVALIGFVDDVLLPWLMSMWNANLYSVTPPCACYSSAKGNNLIVKTLIHCGASFDIVNKRLNTALHFIAEHKHRAMAIEVEYSSLSVCAVTEWCYYSMPAAGSLWITVEISWNFISS